MTPNESPAALLRCANCGSPLGCHSSISFACPTASVGYFTAPGASESRWSVPDGVTHNERVLCEAIVRHQFQDQHRDGRLTIDVETLLHEYNEHKVDAPTPPAVANEEGAFTARVVEWKGIRFGVPAQIAKSFMEALEGTNGEPTAEQWRQAVHEMLVEVGVRAVEHRAAELARSAAAKGEG